MEPVSELVGTGLVWQPANPTSTVASKIRPMNDFVLMIEWRWSRASQPVTTIIGFSVLKR